MSYIMGTEIEVTIPTYIVDENSDPITTLITSDFSIELYDGHDFLTTNMATIAHIGAGLYSCSFTPNIIGEWRLYITQTLYGVEAIEQFNVITGQMYPDFDQVGLTDRVSVQTMLGDKSGDFSNDLTDIAVAWATNAVETYCDRNFMSDDYIEYINGSGRQTIILRNTPITTISEVLVDDVAVTDYHEVFADGILFNEYGWRKGFRNVKVTYIGGYTSIPALLYGITTKLACDFLFNLEVNASMKSEKIGDYQYTLADNANLIDNYAISLTPFKQFYI